MKITARLTTLACVALLAAGQVFASDVDDLTAMLHEFLAATGEEQAHARFWAEDLVYSSSAGLRFGKADIMAGFDDTDELDDGADETPAIVYTGEDVDVRVYGDTAVVAFKLVGTPTDKGGEADMLYYFNTGTFLKRNGVWRVVAWQATKIPPT
jgi:ketosteroid isomerase-like protein